MANPVGDGRPVKKENRVLATGHVRKGRADRSVTVMAVAGVTILTGLGWVLSYAALRQLALSAGMAAWAATLWPLCVDLFVFVATLSAIADRRRGRSTAYAWTLAMAYSAATVAGNVLTAGPDHVAQAVHATPAVTMVLAWHLLSRFFEGHPAGAETARSTSGPGEAERLGRSRRRLRRRPEQGEVATWLAEVERTGCRPTGATVAARFGISGRTGRRMLAEMRGPSHLATQSA